VEEEVEDEDEEGGSLKVWMGPAENMRIIVYQSSQAKLTIHMNSKSILRALQKQYL
jgi:hypothetical protein